MCGERGVFVLPISYGMTKCQASFGDRGMFRWYRQVSTCPPLLPACFGIKTLGIVSIVILPRSGRMMGVVNLLNRKVDVQMKGKGLKPSFSNDSLEY